MESSAPPPPLIIDTSDYCGICQFALSEAKQSVTILACSHTFHEHCLSTHRKRTRDSTTVSCPVCRANIAFPESDAEEDDSASSAESLSIPPSLGLFLRMMAQAAPLVMSLRQQAWACPDWLNWDAKNEKYALDSVQRAATIRQDIAGTWILAANLPFENRETATFSVCFEGDKRDCAVGILSEHALDLTRSVPYDPNGREEFSIFERTRGRMRLDFKVDMGRRRCTISSEDCNEIVLINLPGKLIYC